MKPLRFAVIGAGGWGTNHIRAVATERDCELIAIADTDPRAGERLTGIAAQVPFHTEPDVVLSNRDVDAVIIAASSHAHASLAHAALRAGKHVLVEKPLALRLDDARQLAAAAASTSTTFMVGHLMLFHPAITKLGELMRGGELASLHYVSAIRASLGRVRDDESVLWSFGPHDLSMLDYLLGEHPTRVSASGMRIASKTAEDVAFVTLEYASGRLAQLQLSRVHPRKERLLNLVCADKLVQFDDASPDKLRIYHRGYDQTPSFTQFAEYLNLRDGDVLIPQIVMEEPLRLQLRHFCQCIVDGTRPRSDLASGVRTIEVLDAAQRSLTTRQATVLARK